MDELPHPGRARREIANTERAEQHAPAAGHTPAPEPERSWHHCRALQHGSAAESSGRSGRTTEFNALRGRIAATLETIARRSRGASSRSTGPGRFHLRCAESQRTDSRAELIGRGCRRPLVPRWTSAGAGMPSRARVVSGSGVPSGSAFCGTEPISTMGSASLRVGAELRPERPSRGRLPPRHDASYRVPENQSLGGRRDDDETNL